MVSPSKVVLLSRLVTIREVTTQNYKEGFAKGIAPDGRGQCPRQGGPFTRFSMSPSLSWIDGVATVDQRDNTRFDRGSPEEPLSLLDIGLRMDDKDGGNGTDRG